MMKGRGRCRSADADGVAVLDLPYVGGACPTLVVPDGLAEVEAGLDGRRLARWCAAGTFGQTAVAVPKFRIA